MASQSRQNGKLTYSGRSELLDEINMDLLNHLHADPRISMSALARRVGMSAPAVTERVHRLEQAGIITGYQLTVWSVPAFLDTRLGCQFVDVPIA